MFGTKKAAGSDDRGHRPDETLPISLVMTYDQMGRLVDFERIFELGRAEAIAFAIAEAIESLLKGHDPVLQECAHRYEEKQRSLETWRKTGRP